jgi:hypothetical protein
MSNRIQHDGDYGHGRVVGTPPTSAERLEFTRLRAFVVAAYEHVLTGLPALPETHPGEAADKMWAEGPGPALSSLREAAADVVEMMQELDEPQVEAFEQQLARAGAPSLAGMRQGRVRELFAILHRGTIRDDDEWRIVTAAVADATNRVVDAPTRELADTLLHAYEVRARSTTD